MSSTLISLLAIGLYLLYGIFTLISIIQKDSIGNKKGLLLIFFTANILHALGLYPLIFNENKIDFSIYKMASLVFLVINIIIFISNIKKPLQSLFLFLPPLSIAAIGLSMTYNVYQHNVDMNPGVAAHVILSIVAYSILSISALQALFWSWQNNKIKKHDIGQNSNLLPPLQTMELLMFEMLWAGVILLTIAITVGFFYIDNIFDQHLVHKTVLSLFAWAVFTSLLVGRYKLGWRGNTAVKFILGGFCLLMLAYFGSKIALELIINNTLSS